MGSAHSCLMFIGIKLVGETNSYYLRRERYYETQEPKWEWINYNDKLSQGDDHICLKSHSKESAYTGITLPHPYYNTFDNVTAWPANKISDHFENFKASVAGMPVSGSLELYLYVPYTNRAQHAGSCFTGVTLELLDENNNEYPADKTYTVVNSNRNNYTPDDIELKVGDYPDIINTKIIYKGGFRRTDDSITESWGVIGSATVYSFAEFIGRMVAAGQALPRQNYQARLADLIPSVLLIVEDENNPGKKFIENGISYDDRYQAVDGQFTELIALDVDSLTVDGTTAYTYKKPDVVTVTANPQNIEERVTLIDKNGALVSSPGYLYDKDFEVRTFGTDPVLDDFDGFQRFQIKHEGVTPYNLSPDAGTPQFSITSVFGVNVDGNPNKISLSAGKLINHHFYALDKDDRLTALVL